MIFPLAGLLLGALGGFLGAWRQKGGRLDLLQWAAVGAIIGGLIGIFVLVVVQRGLVRGG
jgi:uncharacterized membrane protein YfcA